MPESLSAPRAPNVSALAAGLSVLVIDDDLLSREVLSLLAEEAGLRVAAFESGEEALAYVGSRGAPDAVITDVQMPGLRGVELAVQMRASCGPATRLLAMSGSEAPEAVAEAYDGFLLKPFSMDELTGALACAPHPAPKRPAGAALGDRALGQQLDQTILRSLQRTMSPAQIRALFTMCLDDAEQRVGILRAASAARNREQFAQAAHTIKGGCSMIGARGLAAMAACMEREGLPEVEDSTPIDEFVAAAALVRGMLVSHRAFGGSAPE